MPDALTSTDIIEAPQEEIERISVADALDLSSKSGMFFNRFFLPESFPLAPGKNHWEMIRILDDPDWQYKALKVHRDGAKTTLARARALKKICFGHCRTAFIISAAKARARESVNWLARKVKYNKKIRQVFGLRIGDKDSMDEVQILNPLYDSITNALAQGMTGQLRGINIDDGRPDFILCDDPCDEENTGTEDQILKTANLFFGSLMNTLAPRSMAPLSELILLQTPFTQNDLIDGACKDSNFLSAEFSVVDEEGESLWPVKWSTKEIQAKKQGYIERNQLHIWLREWEVRISHPALNAFRPEWIDIFSDMNALPDGMVWFLACDPVPPPSSDNAVRKSIYKGDHEVWTVMGLDPKGHYWFVASERMRGHQPDWSASTFENLMTKWNPLATGIETTLFQRVLAYIIRQKMTEIRRYTRIHEVEDKRKKHNKIIDTWTGPASEGKIHIHSSLTHLIEQFQEYPNCAKDDDIDSATIGIMTADECYGGMIEGALDLALENKHYPPLNVPEEMLCP